MAIRVIVVGATGWVGKALVKAIGDAADLTLVGAVARSSAGQDSGLAAGLPANGLIISESLGEALKTPADVVVDYTKPGAVKAHCLEAIAARCHVVVGTSGLGAADYAEIEAKALAAGVGVLAAGNFSITATLLKRFALMAAALVPDVEVIDYAAARKPDVPSGTARELAEALSAVRSPPTTLPVAELSGVRDTRGGAVKTSGPAVQVHSVRMPSFVLSCEALFGLPDERLVIRHDAGSSAAPYVAGTLLAIRRVSDTPGLRRGLDSLM